MGDNQQQKYIKNKFKPFTYTIAVFTIIMFLWWLQGGHILSFLKPQPSPAEIAITTTANIFKLGMANIFSFFAELFR
ncbi:MAG: hypothetical protein KatS3mg095_0294 [Candidatus Parcubacteria bacterium]|nr:MAG: hypothetical protein KatS3mg095_0294 [Candidatus Parcubacteria bacterium]